MNEATGTINDVTETINEATVTISEVADLEIMNEQQRDHGMNEGKRL